VRVEPEGAVGRATTSDRFASARAIADAVLYEGYVLYPYRASSRKNRLRWQFGVLVPPAFSEVDSSERCSVRTECPVEVDGTSVLTVRIRCLQVQHRWLEAATGPGEFRRVPELHIDGAQYVEWDEAVERVVDLTPQNLGGPGGVAHIETFSWKCGTEVELLHAGNAVAGRILRRRETIVGRACVTVTRPASTAPWAKVTVEVDNTTSWAGTGARRDEVMDRSLVAVHTMLAIDGGRFVSLLGPPEGARGVADNCHNDGTFPVLVGHDDIVLSSPIILYDHPEVAPESMGDLYDATEIDEILALRVLTLTDAEKSEARGTDPRAAAIIERVDGFTTETWGNLHGTVRSIGPGTGSEEESPKSEQAIPWWDPAADAAADPWAGSIVISGVEVRMGTRVHLHPSHRADAQDLFLHGLAATVAGIFTDVDGQVHVAVTVEDDPATEELSWQGRYLFFYPDEVYPDKAYQDDAGARPGRPSSGRGDPR
jgi:hypothetical protein